jgi:hypothetical protein
MTSAVTVARQLRVDRRLLAVADKQNAVEREFGGLLFNAGTKVDVKDIAGADFDLGSAVFNDGVHGQFSEPLAELAKAKTSGLARHPAQATGMMAETAGRPISTVDGAGRPWRLW